MVFASNGKWIDLIQLNQYMHIELMAGITLPVMEYQLTVK